MTDSKSKNQIIKAYNFSINFLATRTRSLKEIKDNLYKKKFSDDAISEVILILEEKGFIDDKKFATEFVSTREKIRPKSKFALKYELNKKGISDAIIHEAVSHIDEYQSALNATEPKLSTWLKLDNQQIKNKMINFLKNRGFSWDISFATYEKISKDFNNKERTNEN